MGLEMRYQAIPAESGLIELAREDVRIGESLCMLPVWFGSEDGGPAPGGEGERENPLWDWCCRLVAQYPELPFRRCNLGRRWDKVHYLLSATRRGEPGTDADLAIDRAFGAGELIADHVRATQGIPVRYLPPAVVREIAQLIEPIDHNVLAAQYDPERMEAAGVYKLSAEQADEAEWRWIVASFEDLRQFLLAAAAAGDGAIVCLD